MNSTQMIQSHKCQSLECSQMTFPMEELEASLEEGKGISWSCTSQALSSPTDPYIAISHVWSDGTGVGVQSPGSVNSCLYSFFACIEDRLQCRALLVGRAVNSDGTESTQQGAEPNALKLR